VEAVEEVEVLDVAGQAPDLRCQRGEQRPAQGGVGVDEPEERVAVEDGVAGVDLLIGEPDLIGRGVGSDALDRFVQDVVFSDPAIHACIADPDAENRASLRVFEKAGFRVVRGFTDPEDRERLHLLVRLDR